MRLILLALLFSSAAFAAKYKTGLVIPEHWKDKAQFEVPPFTGVPLPQALDYRATHEVSAVQNQGSCGSCWAFSSVAVLESQLLIHKKPFQKLSEQELVSCDKQSYGCRGGWFAGDYQTDPGQGLASDFPYTASDAACNPGKPVASYMRWGFVGDGQNAPTDDEIKAALVTHGPLAVSIAATSALMNYRGGVFKRCNNNAQTNHLVTLVGYQDDGEGKGYWIVKNSWGQKWGEKGFFRIVYGCNRIGEVTAWGELK